MNHLEAIACDALSHDQLSAERVPSCCGFYEESSEAPGDDDETQTLLCDLMERDVLLAEQDCDLDGHNEEGFREAPASPDFNALEPDPAELVTPRVTGRSRAPKPVFDPEKPLSVYEALQAHGLLRKMTDIVMAKVSMPWHLREEAIQEVHVAWGFLKANPDYARNQLARYAYLSGEHAALKLRRHIGAAVVIPGALFRTGRDSAFMKSIGAAVNPIDVAEFQDSIELSVDPASDHYYKEGALDPKFVELRLAGLGLTRKQRQVAEFFLLRNMSADAISVELNEPVGQINRILSQVGKLVQDRNDRTMARFS